MARELLAQMRKEGLMPNDVTYNALLRGYALQGYAYRGVRPCAVLCHVVATKWGTLRSPPLPSPLLLASRAPRRSGHVLLGCYSTEGCSG